MKKLALILTILLVLASAIGCGAATRINDQASTGEGTVSAPSFSVGSPGSTRPTVPSTTPAPPPAIQLPPTEAGSSGDAFAGDTDRLIIRTGNLALVVEDVAQTIDLISKIATDTGGFVVNSQSYHIGESLRGTITVRVPSETFETAMASIAGLAVDVRSETTNSQDVTEEFVDLQARLKNLEATEQQLLVIMAKAEKVEDVLAVQRELTNTRAQIEQTKGRIQFLERSTSTSLIQVDLEQSRLEVKLTAGTLNPRVGQRVQFFAEVSGGFQPYSYEWDFGDKGKSTLANPTHDFKSAGDYTVILKVTDDRGNTATETREDYVSVTGGWNPGSVARTAWRGLEVFGQGLVNVLIWLGIFSPMWIIGGILAWWLIRRRKKAR